MIERVYTMKEIAGILHTNVNYVNRLRKSGLLQTMKIGSYKVRESTFNNFLAKYDGWDLTDPENPKELVL